MNYLNKAVSSFYTIFEILSIHFGERRTMYYSYWRKKDNVLFILEKEGQCIIHIGERRTIYYCRVKFILFLFFLFFYFFFIFFIIIHFLSFFKWFIL